MALASIKNAWPYKGIALATAKSYLIAMRFTLLPALLVLLPVAACEMEPPPPSQAPTAIAQTAPVGSGQVAVRIGESGPAFDACAIRAVVTGAGAEAVPLHAAPFASGAVLQRVGDGTRMYVCTRSIDQRWLGVVLVPTASGPDGCGLQARLERPQAYAGPCQAGWIQRGLVRLTAN